MNHQNLIDSLRRGAEIADDDGLSPRDVARLLRQAADALEAVCPELGTRHLMTCSSAYGGGDCTCGGVRE